MSLLKINEIATQISNRYQFLESAYSNSTSKACLENFAVIKQENAPTLFDKNKKNTKYNRIYAFTPFFCSITLKKFIKHSHSVLSALYMYSLDKFYYILYRCVVIEL